MPDFQDEFQQLRETVANQRSLIMTLQAQVESILTRDKDKLNCDELVAKRIVIVDSDGEPRIVIETLADAAGICIYDHAGGEARIRAFSRGTEQASIMLHDHNGKLRWSISTLDNGEATAKCFDEREQLRLIAGTSSCVHQHHDQLTARDNQIAGWLDIASIALYDRNGSRRIQASTESSIECSQSGDDVVDEMEPFTWAGVSWFNQHGIIKLKAGTGSGDSVVYPRKLDESR